MEVKCEYGDDKIKTTKTTTTTTRTTLEISPMHSRHHALHSQATKSEVNHPLLQSRPPHLGLARSPAEDDFTPVEGSPSSEERESVRDLTTLPASRPAPN